MALASLRKKPLIEPEAAAWIQDCYAWALRSFGTDIFYDETLLVTPTTEHFPDQAGDPGEMASLLFARVKQYAGMDNLKRPLQPFFKKAIKETRTDQQALLSLREIEAPIKK